VANSGKHHQLPVRLTSPRLTFTSQKKKEEGEKKEKIKILFKNSKIIKNYQR